MKRKFVCVIFALCLALSVIGCGNSKEQQAANYYQNELGLDKEDAEELAKELYGEDEEDTDVVEEETEEIAVDPLPELVNSKWYEQKVQIYDMVFSNDMSMTEEDVRKIVEGSAYNVELTESFDSNGNVCLESLLVDETEVVKFKHIYNQEIFVDYGLLDNGDYYLVDTDYRYMENYYDIISVEFERLETRDNVLAYLAENGFVEVEREQAAYTNPVYHDNDTWWDKVRPEDAEFADTPHYTSNGTQSITLYRMHKLRETNQDIQSGFFHYSGGHLNLVEDVEINFNTDGTINHIFYMGALKCIILGEQIS